MKSSSTIRVRDETSLCATADRLFPSFRTEITMAL